MRSTGLAKEKAREATDMRVPHAIICASEGRVPSTDPVRPLSSVFHPAILFSMLGQLAIHLGCMVYIASLAKEVMGPEKVKEIVEFEKERNKRIDSMDEEAFNDR